jgi:hypothetical protein
MAFYFEDLTIESQFHFRVNDIEFKIKCIAMKIEFEISGLTSVNALKLCIATKTRPRTDFIHWVIKNEIDIHEIVNCNEVTTNSLTFKWKNEPSEDERKFWYLRLKYDCYLQKIIEQTNLIYEPKFKWKDFNPGFIELSDNNAENVD